MTGYSLRQTVGESDDQEHSKTRCPVFAIAGGVAGAYYIISSLVSVEYQGSAGTLVVKLPGQTVYYRPLHPYG